MRGIILAAGAMLALGVSSVAASADPPPIGPIECDRACLKGQVDAVMAAMVAHDAKRLPLAAAARYTENGNELAFGDGFWGTASGIGTYKHYFLDPRTAQGGVYAVLKENGQNVILALRVAMEGRKIGEVEAILSRTGLGQAGPAGAGNLEAMGKPDDVWTRPVPVAERASREDLVRVANMYFTAIENNDGKGVYPFTEDCYRLESGIQTTKGPHPAPPPPPGQAAPPRRPGPNMLALGCKEGLETGFFRIVTRVRGRRFPLVDEETQTVFAYGFFDHNATVHDYTLSDGTQVHGGLQAPFTWELAEAFRIEKGKIRVVEAVLNNVPYGNKAGWEGQ